MAKRGPKLKPEENKRNIPLTIRLTRAESAALERIAPTGKRAKVIGKLVLQADRLPQDKKTVRLTHE